MMIDFHVTCRDMTLEEAARAASLRGYHAIVVNPGAGVYDAALLHNLRAHARECSIYMDIGIFVAAKLTHTAPGLIPDAVRDARRNGAQLVLGFGETISPAQLPAVEGTNLASIEAGVDILLHPGLLTPLEASLAAGRNTALELPLRPDHALANGHIRATAVHAGAPLVFGTGASTIDDFFPLDQIRKTALGAGMTETEIRQIQSASARLLQRLLRQNTERGDK